MRTYRDEAFWLLRAEEMLEQRRITDALNAFDIAESYGADIDRCDGGRWMACMLCGQYERAWLLSDSRRSRSSPDPNRLWNGEDLQQKRVIVRCLHGFGDSVQYLRFVPWLSAITEHVIVEVAPRFKQIAQLIRGVETVIAWDEHTSLNLVWDVEVEATELPYLFRVSLEQLPVEEEYVVVPMSSTQSAANAMKAPPRGRPRRLRVGLVWSAGEWNLSRSIPLAQLSSLFPMPGIEFWNLQGGAAASEAGESVMHDATRICGDGMLSLAATIANLDLVITVDTLAAHLAGAMGKPVWILLQYAADWRWMMERNSSPWYPTVRLFRQPHPGDWSSVVSAVQDALYRCCVQSCD